MEKIEPERVRLGVSACLLGEPVRYDGGDKYDVFLAETLGPAVEWVPVCPEVEIGLGVPRPPMHLSGAPDAARLVVESTGEDLTARMEQYAEARVAALERLGLDGFVLKGGSPSCGLLGVPVHGEDGSTDTTGRGLFAAVLIRRWPALPVEDEERLADPVIRDRFLERVFAAARSRREREGSRRTT